MTYVTNFIMRNFLWFNIKVEEIKILFYRVVSEGDKATLVSREEFSRQIFEVESQGRV